ncbi:MAG: class D beta-lactamase [Xanthomonadales bacterium]|nr:class D beta-lactamase [Xanthomonadales bacterium]NIN60795.1 class D beta-lactamase [Xanthomonadales bacterium]NIN76157.1 class D beta-lactamase [Xanthomonadales bacterium]NIO15378.1 class D beta-lactamase [Xanthomonadales bacterium]NIP13188.1 class D beta-lactamase [Xanthomonadales bacterium]
MGHGGLRGLPGAAFAALLFCGAAEGRELPQALADYFPGHTACALLLERDRHRELRIDYGGAACDEPLSPCSTFKIPHALIGLQTGALDGASHTRRWDGTVHARGELNQDHDLASAMQDSVVWYFQSLARELGEATLQAWLERLDYGNRDLSGGIDRFWLDSSLLISTRAQLALVQDLWRSALPFAADHQQLVRELLAQDSALPGELHGKTGSCPGDPDAGRPAHAWFIGWVDWDRRRERNPATSWFAVSITGDEADGQRARSMTLRLLADSQPPE